MNKVYYIGYYDILENKEKRNVHFGAVTKMNYIISVLNTLNYHVKIISLAHPNIKGRYPAKISLINPLTTLKLFKSSYNRFRPIRMMRYIINKIKYFLYLFIILKKNDIVIVYHSLDNMNLINILNRIKRFKLIYEVEELYSDYIVSKQNLRNKEIKYISRADSYIFSNDILSDMIAKNRPQSVLYGAYKIHVNESNNRYNDEKIHCIYAGGLSKTKGGADIIIKSAIYLDSNYHIHLIGIGSKEDVSRINKMITENNKVSKCKITYSEPLSGKDFDDFLLKFDIGLAIQHSLSKMNVTSFPSKLISYLSNGLKVVSSDIESVKNSKISNVVYFINSDDPCEVAKTIKEVSTYSLDTKKIVKELDVTFQNELKDILNKI